MVKLLTVNLLNNRTMRNLFSTIKHPYWVLYCSVLILLQTIGIKAQINLVPNASFEQYTTCPSNATLNEALSSKPDIWYKPDTRGAGYYNACATVGQLNVPYSGFGFQYARTGVGIVAMYYRNGLESKTYFQIKLFDSLKTSRLYYALYYINLCNIMRLGCNNIGMLFTDSVRYADTSNGKCVMLANPQVVNYGNPIITDTLNWIKVSGIFKAKGGEQYLTLGNFKSNANTAYTITQPTGYYGAGYYVDDVAVYNLDSFCLKADAGRDTTIKVGDSVFIGSLTNGLDSVKWYANGTTLIDSIRPGFWVKPTATGSYFYVLQQVVNGCFSKDTVYVNVTPLPLRIMSYELRITNDRQVENRWTTASEINVSYFNIQRSSNGKDFTTIHKEQAKNQALNNYSFDDELTSNKKQETWFYRIVSVDKDGKTNVSEVRNIEVQGTKYEVRLFPNPSKDVVNVECKEGIKEVKIFNGIGQEIASYPRNDVSIHHLSLSIHRYSKGVYVVQVTTVNGEMKNEKLVVE